MKEFVLTGITGSPKIEYAKELNPEQLDVVLRGDGPCLVLAGAGSGKTRTITYRVAYLLEHGIPADQILLVTFTNKAAREMLSRVEGLLGDCGAAHFTPSPTGFFASMPRSSDTRRILRSSIRRTDGIS